MYSYVSVLPATGASGTRSSVPNDRTAQWKRPQPPVRVVQAHSSASGDEETQRLVPTVELMLMLACHKGERERERERDRERKAKNRRDEFEGGEGRREKEVEEHCAMYEDQLASSTDIVKGANTARERLYVRRRYCLLSSPSFLLVTLCSHNNFTMSLFFFSARVINNSVTVHSWVYHSTWKAAYIHSRVFERQRASERE